MLDGKNLARRMKISPQKEFSKEPITVKIASKKKLQL